MDALELTVGELRDLVPSWELSLRADRKAPGTITTYRKGIDQFLAWCEETGTSPLLRSTLRTWTAYRLDEGTAAATVKSRQLAVRRFTAWLDEEGEIEGDPFAGVKAPKTDVEFVHPLSDDELRAMVAACAPPRGANRDETLRARRDEALIRFMMETGLRAGEVLALTVDDIDIAAGTVLVRRGKGGKARLVPFGATTGTALDRYRRARARHVLAADPAFWLGTRGRRLAYGGLHWALNHRADLAGVQDFHPHRLRNTAAHRWLAAGGSDSGLMAVAGWSSPQMLMRYTKARATDRAIAESRGLNLGDL